MTATLRRLRTGSLILLLTGIMAAVVAFSTSTGSTRDFLLIASGGLIGIVILLQGYAILADRAARRKLRIVMEFLEHDSAPGFCTDEDGAIFAQNLSATDRFGSKNGETMTRALEPLFANPDSVVHRLRTAALGRTSAREDVVTRRGHVRVAVHRVPGGFLWRLEDLADRPQRTSDGVGLPILTFGPSGTVLYMNEVLRGLIGRRVKRLRDVFETVPLRNGRLNRLLSKDGSQTVRTVLSEPVNGRQEVFVLPGGDAIEGQVDLDSLPVAMLRLDPEGRVVFANHLAQDLLPNCGNAQEPRLAAMVEGLGRSVREWVSEAAAGRGLYRPETVRMTGAETETYLQITLGRPLQDGEGGLLAVLNDATELKTLEAQFVQSQKMQAIGQLAGGVAHDFNNLLTAISGHCDLMLLRHAEGDEDYADLMQVTQNANRAAALVGQLLAFSRKQTLEMQPIDLRETLGDLAHLLNRLVGDRVTLRLEHDPALLPIRGDRRQLEQVLMNLVVNARDAMPDGGDIRIETECRFLEEPLSRDRANVPVGQYVVVKVSDEGDGITTDNLGRIFEPFFTTKRPGEGTGLGLSMAYGIIKQSGGYIFVDSKIGQGTVFSLFFPAMSDPDAYALRPMVDATLDDRSPSAMASPEAEAFDASADVSIAEQPHQADRAPEPAARATSEVSDLSDTGITDDMKPDADEDGQSLEALLNGVLEKAWSAPPDTDDRPVSGAEETDPPAVSAAEEVGPISEDAPEVMPAPSVSQAEPCQAIEDPKESSDPTRRVVLLVEDEAPVRAFASRALRLRGYDVLEADCAESALDRLADQDLSVDLFVTDVMMPGLDGPSWVREAMKERPDVRTVFMSGYTQDALSETSVPIPNAMFLAKPFSLADLTRTVERALS